MKHFLRLSDHTRDDLQALVESAVGIKSNPASVANELAAKTLLMIFEKPSLRTRLSFEVGMTQMGGNAIFYSVKDSPLGRKESIEDTSKVSSRMVDFMMARLNRHSDLAELAKSASVPVINGMCDIAHPCQILSDLLTLRERWGSLEPGRRVAYVGDSCNNVTYSWIVGGIMMGFEVVVACPDTEETRPEAWILEEAAALSKQYGGSVRVVHDANEGVRDADVVYTDSWMSYHISPDEEQARLQLFLPFQVTADVMSHAKPDAVFMNCLPANRQQEQTAEVIDGPQSIVFDQAENRLHAQKALLVWLNRN